MKILVTGATNGMGRGVAQILAERDNQSHELILLCRSKDRGEATLKELQELTNNQNLSTVFCDLTRLDDVRRAIEEIHSNHDYLDGMFVNAGLGYAPKRVETEDGLDPHFQVNYLSQFMLTLNLLDLLERSKSGGRVIFNVAKFGEMLWDDMQMKQEWDYEKGVGQGMVAKRMFYVRLDDLFRRMEGSRLSFFGFQIQKTVWTNQINIIPFAMRTMAKVAKLFGGFISIERCGEIMYPLFTESQEESLKKSGKLITWKKGMFIGIEDEEAVFNTELQDKLWRVSLDLCKDKTTTQIAERLL
jgi:hypothetical protein